MTAPVLLWLRRDLRLCDHPALMHALATGRPVLPVFIHDETVEALGAAPRARLGLSVGALAAVLAGKGSRLILRRGRALEVLSSLIGETGAASVVWTRGYDPDAIARDRAVTAALGERGIGVDSLPGALLHEPWDLHTGQGGPYRVFTPFWRALRARSVAPPLPEPDRIPAPGTWPQSDRLADWGMAAGLGRGADTVLGHQTPGPAAARGRLTAFLEQGLALYPTRRDYPAAPGCSGLSEHLAWGEIGPRQVWAAGMRALDAGTPGAEAFMRQLAWREFAWHLLFHFPHMASRNWRPDWNGFAWRDDESVPEVLCWKQGRTGVELVDAGMRQMHVTGRMHNRARMIVASYLTKHLLTDWRIGQRWFAEHLTDWDPAANALGWQWVAGSGPDAAPYFRIFNPDTQAAKFDPDGFYRARWLAEGRSRPEKTALAYFDCIPLRWGLSPDDPPAMPAIDLAKGRARALHAWEMRKIP